MSRPARVSDGASIVAAARELGAVREDPDDRWCAACGALIPRLLVKDGRYTAGLGLRNGQMVWECEACLTKMGLDMDASWTMEAQIEREMRSYGSRKR